MVRAPLPVYLFIAALFETPLKYLNHVVGYRTGAPVGLVANEMFARVPADGLFC